MVKPILILFKYMKVNGWRANSMAGAESFYRKETVTLANLKKESEKALEIMSGTTATNIQANGRTT